MSSEMPPEVSSEPTMESQVGLSPAEELEYAGLEVSLNAYADRKDRGEAVPEEEERRATADMLKINELYAKKMGTATPQG